jgi:hypothetical protein
MDQFDRAIGLLLLCAGPCLLVYSVIAFFPTRRFLRRSTEVDDEIARLERSVNRGRVG